MFEVYIGLIMAYMGLIGFAIIIANFVIMLIAYVVYKCDKGKHNFWQFSKHWKF